MQSKMKILIACEFSGRVCKALLDKGHNVLSCDLLPTEGDVPHHQGDIFDVLYDGWDMLIAFPPCTYLCSSGLHWNKRIPGRAEKTIQALEFVRKLLDAPIPKIALENPIGCISTKIRKYNQIIQPYQFGENASKQTCLWLKGLPLLQPTNIIAGRVVGENKRGKPIFRWANQTDNGQNKIGPSEDRWKIRSITYPGIADAMANQWGC